MPAIDIHVGVVETEDPGNRSLLGRPSSRTVRLMLFPLSGSASWASDRMLRREGYPVATISFGVNRDQFRLEPGDLFRFSYSRYGISQMVCRVQSIQEESIESEKITVTAIEDVEYATSTTTYTTVSETLSDSPNWAVAALSKVAVIETPYALTGGDLGITTLAAKETGAEIGYEIYMSSDGGSSYQKIGNQTIFQPYGILVSPWPTDSPYQVGSSEDIQPAEEPFSIAFYNSADQIETITRGLLFGGRNLALLGNEIISFQTITPETGFQYIISDIYRARLDTVVQDHFFSESFWFIGSEFTNYWEHASIVKGITLYFKFVPYSAKKRGDLSEAIALPITIDGRAKKPYLPGNFNANWQRFKPTYSCASTTTTSTTSTTTTTTTT